MFFPQKWSFFGQGFLEKKEKKEIVFLIVGIPGEPWPSPYLTDSIEIIFLKNGKICGMGVPRDFLIKKPFLGKINALYQKGGIELLKKTLEEIFQIKIDYYLILDLKTLKEITDILGGVEIIVEKDLFDPRFPTKNRGYEKFVLKKGKYLMKGDLLLKYIRTRHPDSDFGRIRRQQKAALALFKKAKKLNLFSDFKKIVSLYLKLKGKTNFSLKDYFLIKKEIEKIEKDKIKFFLLDEKYLLPKKIKIQGNYLWVLIPKKNFKNIKKEIENFCN